MANIYAHGKVSLYPGEKADNYYYHNDNTNQHYKVTVFKASNKWLVQEQDPDTKKYNMKPKDTGAYAHMHQAINRFHKDMEAMHKDTNFHEDPFED